jgi:glycosyltransferase involved in cell wall biosynthesis
MVDGTIRMWRPPRRARAMQYGMRWADRVIANSQAGLSSWRISSSRGRVVYNGFDPARLTLCQVDEGVKDRVFTVVMTGRMDPAKDWRSLFTAVRQLLREDGLSWNVLAIGNGPDRHALMAEARDLTEAGVVSFPDAGLEVLPFVRRAHVGVLMSGPLGEGLSNTIMEYMACGLPVVCSEGGGNREVVLDGRTGFIVPHGDAGALASRLTYLRRETARAREMGMAGRQRLLTTFSAEAMVGETLKVYAEALQLHARSGRA